MQRNVGGIDRAVRIIAGLAIVGAGLYYKSWWGLIGVLPLGSGLLGFCPPYCLLGINTCRVKTAEEQPASGPEGGGEDSEG